MKYKVLNETKNFNGKTLHRIQFTEAVDNENYKVSAGEYGGWIENGSSLPQEGNWVTRNDTIILSTGKISGNAAVLGAVVSGEISGNAFVVEGIIEGKVTDNAKVFSCKTGYNSVVKGTSVLYDTEVKDFVVVDSAYTQDGCIDNGSYLSIGPLGNFNPPQIFTFYTGKDEKIHVAGNKMDDESLDDFSEWAESLQEKEQFKAAIEMAKKLVKTEE